MMNFKNVLNLVFPKNLYCLCCGDVIPPSSEYGLCSECIEKLQWIGENPFERYLEGFSFHSVLSLVYYDVNAKNMVHDLKFHGKGYMAEPMGRLMGDLYMDQIGTEALFIPVPMYSAKERERGYNQAALLCGFAAKEVGMPILKDCLIKTKETASQRQQSAFERRFSLDGSMMVPPGKASEICGKNIVLVDDVLTTGSTAQCCSAELMRAGAASVTVLTFAMVHFQEGL